MARVSAVLSGMKEIVISKGFVVAFALTLACSLLGSYLAKLPYISVIGALVLSLVLGMICQVFRPAIEYGRAGIGFISNKFLRFGIILLGFKLNLLVLAAAGVKTILLAAVVVTAVICGAYWLLRRLKVDRHLAILTASGTGICGAAAVMGIASQLPSEKGQTLRHEEDKVVAVAIVAILGTLFTLIEVVAYPLLGLSPYQFGVMAGGSLHEIAHAVAAGSAAGPEALDIAIITKLSRVLLLAPVCIIVGIWYRKKEGAASAGGKVPIPWFMVGFVLASVAGTFLPFGEELLSALVSLSYLTLGMAMAALGMTVNFKVLFARGRVAFLGALAVSVVLMVCVGAAAVCFF